MGLAFDHGELGAVQRKTRPTSGPYGHYTNIRNGQTNETETELLNQHEGPVYVRDTDKAEGIDESRLIVVRREYVAAPERPALTLPPSTPGPANVFGADARKPRLRMREMIDPQLATRLSGMFVNQRTLIEYENAEKRIAELEALVEKLSQGRVVQLKAING